MADTSQPVRRTALLASAVALLGLVTACGSESATSSGTPEPGRAAPHSSSADPGRGTATPGDTAPAVGAAPSDTAGSASASARTDGRCHTSELRAAVGRVDPGAGQRNFPVVLTNASERTCTVYGYPGAAFVDASGKQLGPDPERAPGSPLTVTLTPGESAWAGLSFSSPQISGARTATPAALLVTPPDEREPLEVKWTAGEVPVGGNESSVHVTALEAGTGP
ncbi:lipoprotein [Streptomyces sp. NRRL WC-3753]|nr:lipoprotein [Streptomyces sp. NRRL WC-3753]